MHGQVKEAERPGVFAAILILNAVAALALRHSPLFFWLPSRLDAWVSCGLLAVLLLWRSSPAWPKIAGHVDRCRDIYIATALALVAWIVRRTGLYYGLPFSFGVDEPAVVGPAVRILSSGDLNPHFFHYPGLGYYLTAMAIAFGYLREASAGLYQHFSDLPQSLPYYYARLVSAVASTLTVPALYMLGKKVAGRWPAVIGALLLALSHLSSESARDAGFHSMAPLFTVVALWALVEFLDTGTTRSALAAGAIAGLAFSSMYYAGTLLPIVLLGVVAGGRSGIGPRLRLAGGVILAFAAAFLATSPYSLLDLSTFLTQFGERMYLARTSVGWGIGSVEGGTALNYARGFLAAFGYASAAFFVFGAVIDIAGWARLRVILFAFVSVHLAVIGSYPSGFGRYLGVAEPPYLLLSATGFWAALQWLRRRSLAMIWLPAALSAAAFMCAVPFRRQIEWYRHARAPIACAAARTWIERNLSSNDTILIETATAFLPGQFTRQRTVARIVDLPLSDFETRGIRYVVVTRSLYTRNLESETRYERYLRKLGGHLLAQFEGNDPIRNPTVEVYELGSNRERD